MIRPVPRWRWPLLGGLGAVLLFTLCNFIHKLITAMQPAHAEWIWAGIVALVALGGAVSGYQFGALREQAARDPLTGLYNRYVWEPAITRHSKLAPDRPLCLMLIDIDNFKEYNDRFGHLIGDQIIQQAAWSLIRHVRSTDIVGRYGGEEFIVILPDIDAETARRVGDRLVSGVADAMTEWAKRSHVLPPPTISVGVAITDPHRSTSATDLLDRADQAMYAAKRAGNTVAYYAS